MDNNKLARDRMPTPSDGEKFEKMLEKWQKQAREEIKQKAETEYDFISDPQGLMLRIKEESKGYVEEKWSLGTFRSKAKNIFK